MGLVGSRKGIFKWRLDREAWRIRVPEDWIDRAHRCNTKRPHNRKGVGSRLCWRDRAFIRGVNDQGRWPDGPPVFIRGRWYPRRNASHFAWRTAPRKHRAQTSRERAARSLEKRALTWECPF